MLMINDVVHMYFRADEPCKCFNDYVALRQYLCNQRKATPISKNILICTLGPLYYIINKLQYLTTVPILHILHSLVVKED